MVGVPQTTRNLEQSETKRVIVIENGEWTSETLPVYMEIVDIKYGELPENKAYLYNVYEAPSKNLYTNYITDTTSEIKGSPLLLKVQSRLKQEVFQTSKTLH
jgi:hypothetical protein